MRSASVAGDYVQAEILGKALLQDNPEYYDVTVYLARVYGWDSKFDSAYVLIEDLIRKEPDMAEAHTALVDLCYWQNNWEKLKTAAEEALRVIDNEDIRAKYALALYHTGDKGKALAQADSVIAQSPDNQLALDVRRLSMLETEGPELFAFYSFDYFQKPWVRRWHMLTAGGVIPFEKFKLIPYVNAGTLAGPENFSASSDLQVNLESYIILSQKNYMLAGYGISPGNYFPRHRAVLEVWQVLPAGFAVSVGANYFFWDTHFLFWSLGIEKYTGNYWFALKNYLFFKDYGFSSSHYLTARRYFNSRYDFVSLTAGYGTAPDEPVVVISDLDRLNAASLRVDLSKKVHSSIRINLSVGYSYEEFEDKNYRNRFNFRIGSYFKLK